jgi:DnaJ-domain-containing protein 1
MLEGMKPETLVRWLILAAVVYLLFPFDLVPDLLGPVGRIDDLAAIAFLVWFYKRHVSQLRRANSDGSGEAGTDAGARGSRPGETPRPEAFDPHAVLGISRSASADEVQVAYRARMQEYHPDKVAHLGVELQTLAHEKSQQIQHAYRQLRS